MAFVFDENSMLPVSADYLSRTVLCIKSQIWSLGKTSLSKRELTKLKLKQFIANARVLAAYEQLSLTYPLS